MGCSPSQPEEPKYVAKLPEDTKLMIMRYILTHQVVTDKYIILAELLDWCIKNKVLFSEKAEAINFKWEERVGKELDEVYAHPEYAQLGDPLYVLESANPEFVAAVAKLFNGTRYYLMDMYRTLEREGFLTVSV